MTNSSTKPRTFARSSVTLPDIVRPLTSSSSTSATCWTAVTCRSNPRTICSFRFRMLPPWLAIRNGSSGRASTRLTCSGRWWTALSRCLYCRKELAARCRVCWIN
uniref:(northern house mosquito) hypothetical protein n=1 Tax=Culex pipiens TaxID=7175 RepID=A0A8D8FEN8_CULPI